MPKDVLCSKRIKWNTKICETSTEIEIFNSNGLFFNIDPHFLKTSVIHKMRINMTLNLK